MWKLGRSLLDEHKERFAQDPGGRLYIYRHGVYVPNGEKTVRRFVLHRCDEWNLRSRWAARLGDEMIAWILDNYEAAPELWDTVPTGQVNLANGLLSLQTRTLRPHDPRFLSSIQLPVAYNPDASSRTWDRFITDTFPEDAREQAYEIPADLLGPDPSIQQAILLEGPGGNGKSTYMEGLVRFVGKGNTTALSLHKLEGDRFAVARLYGKLANICPDLPSAHLTGTSVFKAITGGDSLEGEHKFKPGFTFQPCCRLIFSANSYPRSPDATDAFFDRWEVIPFPHSFRGTSQEIPRQQLDARLAAPEALSGLLNRALEVLPALRSRHHFSTSDTTREALAAFRTVTDPLAKWLDDNTVPTDFVPKDDLLRAYNRDAECAGRVSVTPHAMTHAMKRLRPHVDEKQRAIAGKRPWCWIGLGLRDRGSES